MIGGFFSPPLGFEPSDLDSRPRRARDQRGRSTQPDPLTVSFLILACLKWIGRSVELACLSAPPSSPALSIPDQISVQAIALGDEQLVGCLNNLSQLFGEGTEVVPGSPHVRTAVVAPVEGDSTNNAIARRQHLAIPHGGRLGPGKDQKRLQTTGRPPSERTALRDSWLPLGRRAEAGAASRRNRRSAQSLRLRPPWLRA